MKAVITFVMMAWSAIVFAAPAGAIHGVVTIAGAGGPIEGVTVVTEHGDIAVTDVDGTFTIAAKPGSELTFALTGYASRTVRAGSPDPMRVTLDASATDQVIEIVDNRSAQTKPISYQLTPDEITVLPGAGNDALRAAQLLPGVARIPFGFGGLVLRGTAPSDTAVYLDGIEAPLAFHFGGLTSFYPTGLLSDLSLTSGGFDAEYGRAQGGVVTLTTREPRTDRWRVGGSVGLLDSSAIVEGPVPHGGIFIGLRHSYIDMVAQPFLAGDLPLPSYWDTQIKASFGDPQHGGRLSPMVMLSIDRIANRATAQSALSITSMFARASLTYLRQWGPLTLHVVPWAGTNRLSFVSTQQGETEAFERPEYPAGLRADLTRDVSWGYLRTGIDAQSGYLSRSIVGFTGANHGPMETTGSQTVAWGDVAGWSEARIKLVGDRLAAKPGVRVERYGLTGEVVVDPRLELSHKLTDTVTVRESLGRFHQPPAPGDLNRSDGNPNLESSYYDQAALGASTELVPGWSTSLTGFADDGHRLGVQTATGRAGETSGPDLGGLDPTFNLLLQKQLGFPVHRDNIGRARTYGVELLVKAHVDRYFGMLGYTLARSRRLDNPAMSPAWRPFELDQRHNLNASGSVELGDWRLGAHVRVVSGNPYTPITIVDGMQVTHPWAGTLPWFFQLDLRADRHWRAGWGDFDLYLDVQNVTNRRNVEGIDYDADGNLHATRGLPIIPFIGLQLVPR